MWKKKLFWGIRLGELGLLIACYVFFAFSYYFTLWINRAGYNDPEDRIFVLNKFWGGGLMHYSVFFLFTIPIWYLIFRFRRSWPIYLRLGIHAVTLPIFIYGTQQFYYWISEMQGTGHLQGNGQVWDLYIPALFYLIQFGFFHAYEYFRDNQRKLKLEGELRQASLKSELAAIKAQLNPHFLYNVFNTINASIPPENERTRDMIAQLSDLFRYQLKATKRDLVALREELDFVRKYLDLEKARFESRLKVKFEVAQELLDEKVPPMLLQPLVENSVKHGLSSLIEGGEISVRIFKDSGKLKFEIADTGVGIADKSKLFDTGVGLTNTRLRLQKMYDSTLEILDNEPKGLLVRFSL